MSRTAFVFAVLAVSLVFSKSSVKATFLRDVAAQNPKSLSQNNKIEDALLAKAIPLQEYNKKLEEQGLDIITIESRRLDQDNEDDANEQGEAGDDDYYLGANYMYSFSGYSLKYAKCQPVQRFSEYAIKAGEYTPMVTDDIVILRLCPYRFCSASRTFGCHYNFAEYAISLSDYIRIMIRYKYDQRSQLCDWCESCYARRKLGGQNNDDGGYNQQNNDDGNDGVNGNDDGGSYKNNYYGNDDAVNYANDACYNYQSYCYDSDGYSICEENDDDTYLDAMDYIEYLDCARIADDENYSYYVQPRCDGYDGTIKMALFYDQFCSQYAGNDKSLKSFGLGFQESIFKDFYDTETCLDCSESNAPPYFDANSNMCNRIHISGAKCSTNLQYELFDTDRDESTDCSFIESVRFGTYDETGQLYVDGSGYGKNAVREVTDGQKIGLAIGIGLCVLLAIYSCYLHHSITNLLIKSLSHTDLLPPSRHKSGRRSNSGSRKGRRGRKLLDEEDWENGTPA